MNLNKPKKLSNRNRNAKKVILAVTAVSVVIAMSCVTAFAAVSTTDFINKTSTVLTAVISLIGAGLGVWGVVNLIEGYGNDNPGAKSQGMKQLMAGIALIAVGVLIVPVLKNMMLSAMTS